MKKKKVKDTIRDGLKDAVANYLSEHRDLYLEEGNHEVYIQSDGIIYYVSAGKGNWIEGIDDECICTIHGDEEFLANPLYCSGRDGDEPEYLEWDDFDCDNLPWVDNVSVNESLNEIAIGYFDDEK